MTPEPDKISGLIRRSAGGPLGFAENSNDEVEPGEVVQVAVVKGRKGKVETPGGQRNVQGQARLIRVPQGLISIPGKEGCPISVDDLGKILEANNMIRVVRALSKDRKRRKENLQGD